jgi:SAM-dependent methyltransferase
MVSRRWRSEQINSVLDVGCGVGHWGRVLARVLPGTTQLVGIDREERWIEHAVQRASAAGLSDRFTYRIASAEALPFDDSVFDLVTCQTLLMHVRDPQQVLVEMVRVTRPAGRCYHRMHLPSNKRKSRRNKTQLNVGLRHGTRRRPGATSSVMVERRLSLVRDGTQRWLSGVEFGKPSAQRHFRGPAGALSISCGDDVVLQRRVANRALQRTAASRPPLNAATFGLGLHMAITPNGQTPLTKRRTS